MSFFVDSKKSSKKTLIIWIPGYDDNFVHYHITEKEVFIDSNILYLRFSDYNPKIERSYKTENFLLYMNDIDNELKNIKFDQYEKVWLYSHSSGSLIAILYLQYGKYCNKFDGLIMNDPFMDFNNTQQVEFFLRHIQFHYKTWVFNNFFWRFNKNTVIRSGKPFNRLGYPIKNSSDYPYSVAIMLACSRAQKVIQNAIKPILGDFPILVFIAQGSINTGSKLDGDDTKKWIKNVSSNRKIVNIDNTYHDVFFSEDENIVDTVISKIKDFVYEERSITKLQQKPLPKIDTLDQKILFIPNIICILLIFKLIQLYKKPT